MIRSRPLPSPRSRGFTLLELLTVLVIIIILTSLAIPALTSIKKADELNLATASLASLLDRGRTYAMANNTYTFVCFAETDVTVPTTQTQTTGVGRVAVRVFSSVDSTLNLTASNLAPISHAQAFDNLDLPASLTVSTGTFVNRTTTPDYIVGNSSFPSALTPIVSGNYTFRKIIAFDAQGVLHIPPSSSSATALIGLQAIEIDLQKSNGNTAPAAAKNVSAIQVDGLTGAVTIYRS